jgi:predicted AlkP superfamily pyrophosphatase or phosphodiesterase
MVNKRRFSIFFFLLTLSISVSAQQNKNTAKSTSTQSQPKLVIGLVVDQMRWDYLYKFKKLYGKGGFNRLLNQGFSCDNTMINHLPTYTAVGHTGIYTGSVPAIHGIVGNNWIDRASGKNVYCTDDSTVIGVGSNSDAGKMSPKNMLTTTVADQLRLSNNFKSKVIGISLKDRGAILPAGHTANAAYWYDDKEGKWISSTFYMQNLPSWVNSFNDKKMPDSLLAKGWNVILPMKDYDLSTDDKEIFEGKIPGINQNNFPYNTSTLGDKKYKAFRYTPFGNTYTLKFAESAIENEKLGKGSVTDFLAVSLSSTDYIGHVFGPNSVEVEDTYLRLDNDLTEFLNFLDKTIGAGNYLFFLTADHGVAHNPEFMKENKIPAGNFDDNELVKALNDTLKSMGAEVTQVMAIENSQIYLNDKGELFKVNPMGKEILKNILVSILEKKSFISHAFDIEKVNTTALPTVLVDMVKNSYFPKRSGDVMFIPNPGYLDGGKTGTTHGLWNPYDAHIPLVWYGWNIKTGRSHKEVHMTDIAATLSALLDIQIPDGCVGKVIEEVVK